MTGALMQLVAYGGQDIFLTGNPQISFFKSVYKQYTNFSIESIRQNYNGKASQKKCGTSRAGVTISRSGDLLSRIYLNINRKTFTFKDMADQIKFNFTTDAPFPGGANAVDSIDIPSNANSNTIETILNDAVLNVAGPVPFVVSGNQFGPFIITYPTNGIVPDNNKLKIDSTININITDLTIGDANTKHQQLLTITFPEKTFYYPSLGYRFIESVEIEIGGIVIDKHYGDWLTIWNDLTLPIDKKLQLNKMLYGKQSNEYSDRSTISDGMVYIPLNFWFCNNPGLALPLIALQYHKIELNIYFDESVHNKDIYHRFSSDGYDPVVLKLPKIENIIDDIEVWADYIFLDTEERKKFVDCSHEYLIEQVQTAKPKCIDATSCSEPVELFFNHPVKELIWYIDNGDVSGNISGSLFPTIKKKVEIVKTASLKFNNTARFEKRPGSYFTNLQRYQYHSGFSIQDFLSFFHIYNTNPDESDLIKNKIDAFEHSYIPSNGVHIYSFALDPERAQPTGTCNFSRLSKVVLHLECYTSEEKKKFYWFPPADVSTRTIRIFARSYNILKIEGGMGSLLYSN